MDLWKKAKALAAEFAPDLAASLVPPPAGGIARRLLSGVLGTPDDDPEAMVRALSSASPEQKLSIISEQNRHKEALMSEQNRHEEAGDTSDANKMESVNATMRVEAVQHPWSGQWRPVWGFASAGSFVVIVCSIMISIVVAFWKGNVELLTNMPLIIGAVTALFAVPMTILGVASHHRGKMQRAQAGDVQQTTNAVSSLVRAFKK